MRLDGKKTLFAICYTIALVSYIGGYLISGILLLSILTYIHGAIFFAICVYIIRQIEIDKKQKLS